VTLYVVMLVRGERFDLAVEVDGRSDEDYAEARRVAQAKHPGGSILGVY
jgi:hypothetical protein